MRRRRALSLCSTMASVALAVLVFGAAPAGAATTSSPCSWTTTQAFSGWADTGSYFLVPGGGFESGAPGWSLAGGAALVAGNNTAGNDPASSTTSLALPAGSSATSPLTCVTATAPTMRFFARNTGSPTAKLGVWVLFTLPNGWKGSLLIAQITGSSSWQPSPVAYFYANLLALISPTGTTNVAFQFRPLDANGRWQVDDVYVDPFKRGR